MYTLKYVLSLPMYLRDIHNFNKSVSLKGLVSFYKLNDLDLHLSELNAPHIISLFLARVRRRPVVGHDKIKVEQRDFSHNRVSLTFYIHEGYQENVAKNLEQCSQMSNAPVLQYH